MRRESALSPERLADCAPEDALAAPGGVASSGYGSSRLESQPAEPGVTGSDMQGCKTPSMDAESEGGTVIPWPGPTREQEDDQALGPQCELVPAAELVAAFALALSGEIERQQQRRAAGVKALLLACLAGLLGGPVVLALLAALVPEIRSTALGVALALGVPSLLLWKRSKELHQRARPS